MNKSNFYYEFENRFRGSRDQVKITLLGYDNLLEKIINTANDKPNLLDIGSGRGEWLEICEKRGFKTLGIDSNTTMNNLNSNLNLDILQGNVFDILPKLPSNKYDIITAFHFIEHINNDALWTLLEECKRLLTVDGILLLETPSIDNLSVSSRLFFLDPTHINPINPDYIAFHLENIGFNSAKYFLINGGPLQNSEDHTLTRVLNGVSQDVCIIGTKSYSRSKQIFIDEINWQNDINKSISTFDAAEEHDSYLRALESRLLIQEEAIFELRKRVTNCEKSNEKFFYFRKKIINFPFFILINYLSRVIKKIIFYIRKIILSIISFIINSKVSSYLLSFLASFKKSRSFFIFIRFLMNKLGLKIYFDKIIYRIQQKEISSLDSIEQNSKLLGFYNSTPIAQDIYRRINKEKAD